MAQLDLFAPQDETPWAGRDELVALASRVPTHVHLGTSSWTFPGWQGLVYHRTYGSKAAFTRESLREYAAYPLFRTVCMDRGYYAPIPEEQLIEYRTQLPVGFLAIGKVWSEVATRIYPHHPRYGKWAGKENPNFLDLERFENQVRVPWVRGLGENAGPLLLEIPPAPGPADPGRFLASLRGFLRQVRTPIAVELRDSRLLSDDYFSLLRETGAAHAFNFWSRMPAIGKQLDMAGEIPGEVAVVRLMLPPGMTYEQAKAAFSPFDQIKKRQGSMREDVMRLVQKAGQQGKEVFVIVNNKAEGSSPLTVRELAELMAAGDST